MVNSLKRGGRPKIPAELQDMVIDQLHREKAALTQCSLVCRDWAHRSRLQLFRTLSIMPAPSDKYFTAFRDFLETKPLIVEYVKRLELRGNVESHYDDDQWHQHLDQETLLPILRGLPKLADLSLYRVEFPQPQDEQQSMTYGFQLSRLELDDVIDRTPLSLPNGLLRVLQLFDYVSVLQLNWLYLCSPRDRVFVSSAGRNIGIKVYELDITYSLHEMEQTWLFDLLINSPAVDSLTSVYFGRNFQTETEIRGLGSLLRKAGSHIQNLSVNIWTECRKMELGLNNAEEQVAQLLGLEMCTSLKLFAIAMDYDNMDDDDDVAKCMHLRAWMTHMDVLRTTPKSLECLRFDIFVEEEVDWLADPNATDWKAFRSVLTRLSGLKVLQFTFRESAWSPDTQAGDRCVEIIKRMLPDARERGILQLEVINLKTGA